tara:strand:- start:4059 stop:4937 length:879 start_codon:yes stop_codon:yes gene_type:complete
MKFSLHFGNLICPDPTEAKKLAIAAETAGFESVIAVEHVVIPSNYSTKYPYSKTGRLPGNEKTDWPDPLAWLTFIGAVTRKLKLITGVLVLPQRNPVILAKHLATIDRLTSGRIELGIGVGWLREEFNALNVQFKNRGERTDEYIQAMQKLWREDAATFKGKFINFDSVNCNPKPIGKNVPIIIGGHSARAVTRAAEFGDGFFPATGMQNDLEPILSLLWEKMYEIGREPDEIEIMTGCPELLTSPSEEALKEIKNKHEQGIQRLVVPLDGLLPEMETNILRFGEQIINKAE